MLQTILNELHAIMAERAESSTVYCGLGTYAETLIDDYLQAGGSRRLLRAVLRLA